MSSLGNVASAVGAAEIASRQKQSESAVMDGLSSSKVTVEYHDPSGLFSLVQEQLVSRLPLKNLHWKAPTRPLRSIDSLHVDLVPSTDTASQAGIAASTPTSSATDHGKAVSKERRHQIPGLRQTPYLKVYLLRCNDAETYKSTVRKQVREWVKTHTPPSQSSSSANKQENHDAFEWMILHVVLPDTPAASQPRSSASAIGGEKEKSNIASRFTKGTTTILEKLRADFNTASKSAPERIAQVRLQKETVPPHMLPQTATVTSPPIVESPEEQERAWSDVIVKFKTLILLSFDLRVSQYEEDIREKDSQRSLPGWNFCTFFILKEGLARGFESVGLVEDALLGYDELSIGLDTVSRDQAMEGSSAQGSVISDYTEELYQQASKILDTSQQEELNDENGQLSQFHDDTPINANKKDYRGQILSNNISVFDFRTYIFARQMSLLLRLGNSQSARSDLAAKLQPRPNAAMLQRSVDDSHVGIKSGSIASDSEDLFSLAELCSRALNFITFGGRLLRSDLLNGAKAHETTFTEQFVDTIARSWSYSALEQILRETSTSSLPFTKYVNDGVSGSSGKTLPFGKNAREQKIAVSEPKSMIHPSRSSSLNYGRSQSSDAPYAQPTSSAQTIFENGQYQDRSAPKQESSLQPTKNGQQELAGTRAQLLAIQRRILEHVGLSRGWKIGLASVLPTLDQGHELNEISLDNKDDSDGKESSDEESNSGEGTLETPIIGISAPALKHALSSIDAFRQFYEALSDLIVKHYMAAGQTKSGENVLGDLAALRFELGDFAAAAMYFGRMASIFAESRWNTVETTMLKMYAQCLKKLNRKDEFVRTLLDVLAKSAASKRSMNTYKTQRIASDLSQIPKDWLDDDKVNTIGTFAELVDYSQQLPYDVNVQMAKYFNDVLVEPYVRHFDDKDGFQLRLQFRHLLEDEVDFEQAKVRLIDAISAQGKDIWLESTEAARIKKGINRIWLSSNLNTIGAYVVDKIILQTKRIAFVHEPFVKAEATTPLGIMTSVSAASLKSAKKNRVSCFPRTESFRARLYLSHFIHIDRPRHIEIECSSGWNDIQRAEIRLKSASAGLRLRTADAAATLGDAKVMEKPNPGVIRIGAMEANTTATFQVPYETEMMLPDLTVKMEIDYFTENGQFQYYSSFTIPVELPLDVNVHDHFKNASLFSKFNIKTASQVPLEILDVSLEGSDEYNVSAPRKPKGPFYVLPKQPVAVAYKVIKKGAETVQRRRSQVSDNRSLSLSVEYRCLDEDVLERVRALFQHAVEGGPVHRLAPLLINTFVDRLKHRILPSQFERIALLEKVDLGPFEGIGWTECVESLPQVVRDDTRKWLEEWHQNHKIIPLPRESDAGSPPAGSAPPAPYPPRLMTITVSIPQTHILHTAALSLVSSEYSSSQGSTIAVVGQPLMAELRIKHTRRWCTQGSLMSAANLSSPTDPIEFVYTIEANPDTWLIAGQRRAHFTSKEDEEQAFSIMLIPLRSGTALLPNVEIRAKIPPKSEENKKADGAGEVENLNCETDCLSYGECVVVVPDVRSSTVGIGEMSTSRSAIWLEAESR